MTLASRGMTVFEGSRSRQQKGHTGFILTRDRIHHGLESPKQTGDRVADALVEKVVQAI